MEYVPYQEANTQFIKVAIILWHQFRMEPFV